MVHSWATKDPGADSYDVDQPQARLQWLEYEFWRKKQVMKDIQDGKIRHVPTGNYNRISVAAHRKQCEWSQHMEHMENLPDAERAHWSELRETWLWYEHTRVDQQWYKEARQVPDPKKNMFHPNTPPKEGEHSRPDPTQPQEWFIYKRTFKYVPPNWRPAHTARTQVSAARTQVSPSVRRNLSMFNTGDGADAWESTDPDDGNTSSAAAAPAVPRPKEE